MDRHVRKMLRAQIIEHSNSPWVSNMVVVTKKDGTPRFCIDFRKLNEVTRKDAYPLPLIETCLDALAGATLFSTFDLRSGYHQMRMSEKDADKTSFVTREGTFRYKVLPFGLCNAGASFQRLMDLVMAGLNFKACLVYLDDIIVFSVTVDQHLGRVAEVFKRLRTANLKVKPSKCKLMQDRVEFLGHIVSADGVATDPTKIEAVEKWPAPKNLHEVRSFLGLCGYYRRFVKNFAAVASPMTALTEKGRPFRWGQGCQDAFEQLKAQLVTSPVLAMPRDKGQFILDTDASNWAVGAVLSQVQDGIERVIAYSSRVLSRPERNYCVTRRELLAVTYYLKKFRQYLLGRHFLVRTDHAALLWLKRTPEPIGQQARWISFIDEFQFDIEHRPGKKHGNADAMSRIPCQQCGLAEVETGEVLLSDENQCDVAAALRPLRPAAETPIGLNWDKSLVSAASSTDVVLKHIVSWMRASSLQPEWDVVKTYPLAVRAYWRAWPRLQLIDGVLYRKWFTPEGTLERLQMVVPASYQKELVRQCHIGMTGGHLGLRRTLHQVQRRAYWVGWTATVQRVLKECPQCQSYQRGKPSRKGEMQTMSVGAPLERIGIDVTGPFPKSSRGNKFMVTLVDHYTKWAEAYPVPNHEAPTVARVLVEQFIVRFGVPVEILSDQGSEFCSHLFTELCRVLGADKLRTTAYKPSTNGAIERFHRTLNSIVAKAIEVDQRHWCENVPIALAAYRASRHEATGYSPNMLMLGREVTMPIDLVLGLPLANQERNDSYDIYVSKMQDKFRCMYEEVRLQLAKVAERSKDYYDLKVRPAQFAIGDWVWYYLPRAIVGRTPKWHRNFEGPFLVVKVIGPVNYSIQASVRAHTRVVHVDTLKPYYGVTPKTWLSSGKDSNVQLDQDSPLDENAENILADSGWFLDEKGWQPQGETAENDKDRRPIIKIPADSGRLALPQTSVKTPADNLSTWTRAGPSCEGPALSQAGRTNNDEKMEGGPRPKNQRAYRPPGLQENPGILGTNRRLSVPGPITSPARKKRSRQPPDRYGDWLASVRMAEQRLYKGKRQAGKVNNKFSSKIYVSRLFVGNNYCSVITGPALVQAEPAQLSCTGPARVQAR